MIDINCPLCGEKGNESKSISNHFKLEHPWFYKIIQKRQYYIDVWGFDPLTNVTQVKKSQHEVYYHEIYNSKYKFEESYELNNDPILKDVGVKILARTYVGANGVFNKIVFTHDQREHLVNCNLYSIIKRPISLFESLGNSVLPIAVISLEDIAAQNPILPSDEFVYLKSYIAGIAELGLENILSANMEFKKGEIQLFPFTFQENLRTEIAIAIFKIKVGNIFFSNMIDNVISQKNSSKMKGIRWFLKLKWGTFALRSIVLNPKTPLNVLIFLANNGDSQAKKALSHNPKIPEKYLQNIAYNYPDWFWNAKRQDFSKEFMNTIILTKLILEEKVIENIDETQIEELMKFNNRKIRKFIAGHPNTPPNILKKLAMVSDQQVLNVVVNNPNSSSDILMLADWTKTLKEISGIIGKKKIKIPTNILHQLKNSIDPRIRGIIATFPKTPVDILDFLSKDDHDFTRVSVSNNKNTSSGILSLLKNDVEKEVRNGVAGNPNCTSEMLEYLAYDISPKVRETVARNPETPQKSLSFLVNDYNKSTRWEIARNSNTSPSILYFLTNDYENHTREEVAKNPNTNLDILEILVTDPHWIVRRTVAERDDVTSSLLLTLSQDSSWTIRKIVAKHLKTPIKALEIVGLNIPKGRDAPAKVLVDDVLKILAEREDTPSHVLEHLEKEKNHYVNEILAGNPHTPKHVLENLVERMNTKIKVALAKNPNSTPYILGKCADSFVEPRKSVAGNIHAPSDLLNKLGGDKEEIVRNAVANNPKAPAAAQKKVKFIHEFLHAKKGNINKSTFEYLFRLSHEWIREKVASHPETPIEILEKLSKNRKTAVQRAVARNPKTPITLLRVIAKDNSSYVRCEVVYNPNTPLDLFETLLLDKEREVHRALAQSPYTPVDILEKISKKKNVKILNALAENKNAPKTILARLSKHEDKYIRRAVGGNVNTPEKTLELLIDDEDKYVVEAVAKNPAITTSHFSQLVSLKKYSISDIIAKRTQIPLEIQEKLAQYDDSSIRFTLARNSSVSEKILVELSKDTSKLVREYILKNANAPLSILKRLAVDEEVSVREAVLSNPNINQEILKILAHDENYRIIEKVLKRPNNSIEIYNILSSNDNYNFRIKVAKNLNTPLSILESLSKDKNSNVRKALIQNPNTPLTVLESLAKDEDESVRLELVGINDLSIDIIKILLDDCDLEIKYTAKKRMEDWTEKTK